MVPTETTFDSDALAGIVTPMERVGKADQRAANVSSGTGIEEKGKALPSPHLQAGDADGWAENKQNKAVAEKPEAVGALRRRDMCKFLKARTITPTRRDQPDLLRTTRLS